MIGRRKGTRQARPVPRPRLGLRDRQRALTGTAVGAGGGAVLGAIGGNAGLGAAAGAGAGLLGGLLFDQSRQAQDRAFQQGFAAGQRRQ